MKSVLGFIVGYLVVYTGISALIALWTWRTLGFWVPYFKHASVDVPYWLAFLLTFLLPGISWAANIISEVGRLFA